MRYYLFFTAISLFAIIAPAIAALDPLSGSMYWGQASGDIGQWQRIDFRSAPPPLRKASQIKVSIKTNGPSMQGLIRIPGGIASNFDTGKGVTVVDLINVGDDTTGYAEIVALEVLFTRSMPGQSFTVDYVDGIR